MGDGGYIQTGSRRGSFKRTESSFKEWEENSNSQGSTSMKYVSQTSYSGGTVPGLGGFGQTGDGSPEPAFGWSEDRTGGGLFGSSSSAMYKQEEMSYESSSGMSRMARMGYVGTVGTFGVTSDSTSQGIPQDQGTSRASYGFTGSEKSNPQITDRGTMSDMGGGGYEYTVASPRSVKSSGNIPVSLDEMMQSGGSSMLTIENVGNVDGKDSLVPDASRDGDGWMNRGRPAPVTGSRIGWGNSLHGSPRSQLSPVMEVADCPTPDNALVGSRTPIVKKPEEDYHQTQEESPPVSPRSRENVYQLSQFPLGPNVSNHSESGAARPNRWNGRPIDATVVAGPPRAVREQYIHKLRGAGEHMLRLGKFCVKNVWFWVALVGVIAGAEGFNEERKNKSHIADESWWSDEEED